MYIDDTYLCFTLEDKVRQIPGIPVEKWKIKGQTAIPTGTYKVVNTYSNHFGKWLPELIGVEGFLGVRIHTGNDDEDTEGCILVGTGWAGTGWISGSKAAFEDFNEVFKAALAHNEEVWLTIA